MNGYSIKYIVECRRRDEKKYGFIGSFSSVEEAKNIVKTIGKQFLTLKYRIVEQQRKIVKTYP